MAEVRVNRELLTDVVDDLDSHHLANQGCCARGFCATAQRLERIKSVLSRDQQVREILGE